MAEIIALILALLGSLGFGPNGGGRRAAAPPRPAPAAQEVPAQIPTPALIPGLLGLGAAALRKKKQEEGEEGQEQAE